MIRCWLYGHDFVNGRKEIKEGVKGIYCKNCKEFMEFDYNETKTDIKTPEIKFEHHGGSFNDSRNAVVQDIRFVYHGKKVNVLVRLLKETDMVFRKIKGGFEIHPNGKKYLLLQGKDVEFISYYGKKRSVYYNPRTKLRNDECFFIISPGVTMTFECKRKPNFVGITFVIEEEKK